MKIKELIDAYIPFIEEIISNSSGTKYQAMFLEPNPEAFHSNPSLELFQIVHSVYVRGVLERSNLACLTSLARTSRWLLSTERSASDENVLAFSCCLRGLLESSSDSFYLFKNLYPTLKQTSKYLYVALNYPTDLTSFINFENLENPLIHYAYAKHFKKGEEPLPHHRNKPNSEYIKSLEDFGIAGLSNLYAELCQLTHPASPSVFCFIDETDEDLTFNPRRDSLVINDILSRYHFQIISIVQQTLNPTLMTLSLLNRLESSWPALSDEIMSTVGNTVATLAEFDNFSKKYCPGTGFTQSELNLASGN